MSLTFILNSFIILAIAAADSEIKPYRPVSNAPFSYAPVEQSVSNQVRAIIGNPEYFYNNVFQSVVDVQRFDDSWCDHILPLPAIETLLNIATSLTNDNGHIASQLCSENGSSVAEYKPSDLPMLNGEDFKLCKRVLLPSGEYWSGMSSMKDASFQAINKAFNEKGLTLIINGMERRWHPIADLVFVITKYILAYPVAVNLYFTPAMSQGFEAHADWMDVFIVQLSGKKQWKLYPGAWNLSNPFSEMIRKPSSAMLNATKPFEIDLSVGNVLYIPAGCIHEASTVPTKTLSLHLTFGIEIEPIDTWTGLLIQAIWEDDSGLILLPQVASAAIYHAATKPENFLFRKAIPFGDWKRGNSSHMLDYFKYLSSYAEAVTELESLQQFHASTVHFQLQACVMPWPEQLNDTQLLSDALLSAWSYLSAMNQLQFDRLLLHYTEKHSLRLKARNVRMKRDLDTVESRLKAYLSTLKDEL